MSRVRITGGSARGRPLKTPPSGTRPTPAKLRAAVFDSIQSRSGHFLDLYAGSGAMGLEAASRGWQATCVELAPRAAAIIRDNARTLGLDVNIVRGDAQRFAADNSGFDVVFASPPYTLPDLAAAYYSIIAAGPARPGGLYLLQHPTELSLAPDRLPDWALVRRRTHGSNTISEVAVPGAV